MHSVVFVFMDTLSFLGEQISIENIFGKDFGSRLELRRVGFGNSYRIYGIVVYIYQYVDKREAYPSMEDEGASVLLFIGETNDIVLVSRTVL